MKRLVPRWGLYRFFLRDLYSFVKSYIKTHYDLDGIPQQTCKECGVSDGYDFHLPNAVWDKIVPLRYRNGGVLCLHCFDRFAAKLNFDYRSYLTEMCFAGDIAGIEFDIVESRLLGGFGEPSPPDYLFHRIAAGNSYNYEEDVVWATNKIKEEGLIPLVAMAWANLIPKRIRHLPIVWLTERIKNTGEVGHVQWLKVRTTRLERSLFFKLVASDVEWWVYQGHIPVSAIELVDVDEG